MTPEQRLTNRLRNGLSTATLKRRADHGTHRCYVASCRCDPCTDAEAAYSARQKARRSRPRAWMFCRAGDHHLCPVSLFPQKTCGCSCHVEEPAA